MKNTLLAQAFSLLVLLVASSTLSAQDASLAFFDVETITKIMGHRDCTGIRFYKVLKPGTSDVSTMAIGVRADNSEISNFSNRYYLFSGKGAEGLEINKLSKSKAVEACLKLKERGDRSFAATFTKEDLTSMLTASEAKGIVVKEKKLETDIVFEAQAAVLIEGSPAPLQRSEAMRSGEPCPTFCGDTRNYIHM